MATCVNLCLLHLSVCLLTLPFEWFRTSVCTLHCVLYPCIFIRHLTRYSVLNIPLWCMAEYHLPPPSPWQHDLISAPSDVGGRNDARKSPSRRSRPSSLVGSVDEVSCHPSSAPPRLLPRVERAQGRGDAFSRTKRMPKMDVLGLPCDGLLLPPPPPPGVS